MKWIKASERLPEEKRQIVTKDELGNYGVHTLFGTVWRYDSGKYWEPAEGNIIEWLSEEAEDIPVEAAAKEYGDAEEIWDEYSTLIGSDIDDLQYYAGRDVITKGEFKQLAQKYHLIKKKQ